MENNNDVVYDVAIIGGGPGGAAAAIYAARKKLKTLIVTDYFGGQSLVSADIQNWIGTPSISGYDFGKMLEGHVRSQRGITIEEGSLVKTVTQLPEVVDNGRKMPQFFLTTEDGKTFTTRTVLAVSGSHRMRLGVPGEKDFEGKGVVYCSICDAPLFQGKDVAVVGGGNAGLEAVIDLLPYATNITLLHRNEALKGDPVTQEKIKSKNNVSIILNAQTQSIIGKDSLVTELIYLDKTTNKEVTLSVQGVFVEIGAVPNSDMVKKLVATTDRGEIIVDHKNQRTSLLGIWSAGDVSDGLYRQNNISVGDSVKAILDIYAFLNIEGGA